MAELKGGTTIGGYTALHSGLKEAYLGGNLTTNGSLTVNGKIHMGVGNGLGIFGKDGHDILTDHNNGNLTLNAPGGQIYLGYSDTTGVRLYKTLYASNGTTDIIGVDGTLFYKGENTDTRYVRMASDPYMAMDLSGTTQYPRLAAKNTGATTSANWIRVSSDAEGLLPYSNGNSYVGTDSWRFKEINAVNFRENGVYLSSKYAAAGHNHDSTYVNRTGDSTANLNVYATSNNSGYQYAALEIRELNQGSTQTGALSEAPRIAFHWGGRVASQIAINTDSTIMIRNNPGTGYEKFAAGSTTVNGNLSVTGSIAATSYIDTNDSIRSPYFYGDAIDTLNPTFRLWGSSTAYGFGMATAFTYGYLNDYATFFTMNNDADRGWIWRYDGQAKSDGAMSLTTSGQLYVKGVVNCNYVENRGFDFRLGSGDQVSRGDTGGSRALVKNTGARLTINYGGDFSGGVEVDSGMKVSGQLAIHSNGGSILDLVGTDHGYIEYYARGASGSRSAWVGYGSSSSTAWTVSNALGQINLETSNNEEIWSNSRRVPRITWGTSSTPPSSGNRAGDIYIDY
jgi:hypothetical protein